ncbi:MAG: hypothetical protein HRT86_12775 [Ilumatobacteraceae bacterium]|nr:hypothetical protein [Ilumatobacteraceae bacterium]
MSRFSLPHDDAQDEERRGGDEIRGDAAAGGALDRIGIGDQSDDRERNGQ